MKSFIVVMSVALLGGGGTYVIRNISAGGAAGVPAEALYTVERGKLTVTITENGSLMAKNSEKINFRGKRGGEITFLIEEGKTVAEDEIHGNVKGVIDVALKSHAGLEGEGQQSRAVGIGVTPHRHPLRAV